MVEKLILDYLTETLDVPVHMEKPEPPPDSYVLIEKTGSSQGNRVNHATLAVQSYAPTLYEAAELNEQVKKAMDSLAYLPQVGSSRLNSDYNFTDTTNKTYRYQAVYDLTHY